MSAFLLPVVVAIAAAAVLVHLIPKPRSGFSFWAWWALVIVAPWIVYAGVNRLARRALPLAALLKMTLVFPDHAPSRLAVARRAGSTRALERQLHQTQDLGARDEPSVAAEQILALATSLNKHDRLTRGHSERVRALTDMIADQLKLPTADRDRLRWSALLHDIGKLTVPVAVLNKAGKPDDAEWQILLGHPLEGQRLAAPLAGWLGPWAATIPEHHEKYDGSGYPHGLSGEQISLGGRIVAVADSYDAMTSVRSYKKGASPESARRELAACAGAHFDPVVVRAFLEASVGRHDLIGAPLAWLGELSTVNGVPELGQVVSRLGNVFSGMVAVAGLGAIISLGAHHAPTHRLEMVGSAAPAVPAPSHATGTTAPPVPESPAITPQRKGQPAHSPAQSPIAPSRPVSPPDPPAAPPLAPIAPVAGAATPPSPVVTPAGVPGVPVIGTASAGDASATVDWTAPASDGGSPITNYDITTYVGGTPETTVTVGNVTSDVVSGLTNGTAYTFAVSAINAVGEGLLSSNSNSVTPAGVPGAPLIGTASAGDASATVTWTAPASDGSPIMNYLISAYVGGTATIAVGVGNVTSDVVGGLTDGTAYTFTVSAMNAVGFGASSPHSGSVTPATVPGAPAIGTASAGDASATVTWTAPTSDGGLPINGYTVTATDSTTPANGGQTCTWTTGPLTCSATGLTDGDSYSFTVTATNGVGTGASSGVSNSVTPATVPGAPVIGTASAGDASATVTWTAPASDGGSPIMNYLISAYVGGTATIAVGVGNVTSDTVSGLINGTAYTFTVSAMNAVGFGASSGVSNSVTPATVPGAPVIGTASAGDASATVTWTAPASDGGSAISGYTVTSTDSTTPANGGQTCTWTSGPLTCSVTGLTDGDSYSFTVTATDGVGTGASSGVSNSVTPAGVPGVPVIGTASAGDASATVDWTAPASDGGSPITNYDITTYVGGTPETTVTVGNVTSDVVSGLTNGTAYTFAVSAINAVGEGLLSSNSNSVTPAGVPGAPLIGTASAGDASATVTWTAPPSDGGSSITGYTVTAADGTTPANGGQTCNWITGPLTCSVTGLTNGDSYSFTVTATNGVGTGASSGVSNSVTPAGASVSSLTLINGSGNSGRADAGDQIIVTFATPPTPSAFCSLWSSSSYPDLTGSNVVVTGQPILLGNDEIASVADSSCSGGFRFGTIDLGQIGYFNTLVTFSNSTIHWDGTDTLTITLGTPSIGDPTQNNPSVAVYAPDPALGVSGTISSPSEVQF